MVSLRRLGIWCLLLYLGPDCSVLFHDSLLEECMTYILFGSGELDYTFFNCTAAVYQLESGRTRGKA